MQGNGLCAQAELPETLRRSSLYVTIAQEGVPY